MRVGDLARAGGLGGGRRCRCEGTSTGTNAGTNVGPRAQASESKKPPMEVNLKLARWRSGGNGKMGFAAWFISTSTVLTGLLD